MTIKVSRASEANLNTKGTVIQVSATYEIHLTGSDLHGLSLHADRDGIPGVIVEALDQYLAAGGKPTKCLRCDCGACPGWTEPCTCPGYTRAIKTAHDAAKMGAQ